MSKVADAVITEIAERPTQSEAPSNPETQPPRVNLRPLRSPRFHDPAGSKDDHSSEAPAESSPITGVLETLLPN